MSTRGKNVNQVDAASLARWIVITGFLALAGLCYVYLTLQLHRLGDRRKILETELANLRTENDLASVQIIALTSRSALQRRLRGLSENGSDHGAKYCAARSHSTGDRRGCHPTGGE